MQIRDVMTRNAQLINPNNTIQYAAKLMYNATAGYCRLPTVIVSSARLQSDRDCGAGKKPKQQCTEDLLR